jgi:dynein intermediate chain 2
MNDYEYVYTKLRKDLGSPCSFSDTACVTIAHNLPSIETRRKYSHINSDVHIIDCTPELSAHIVNTERVCIESRSQFHKEGGWPREIDPSEPQETTKWRKRLEKDPRLSASVPIICKSMRSILNQNRVIDLFEEYFSGESSDLQTEAFDCNTVGLFKNKNTSRVTAGVSSISWHPDGCTKFLACSCSTQYFSGLEYHESANIWNVESSGSPTVKLQSLWSLLVAQFYARNPELIAGGNKSGRVEFFDLRTGTRSVGVSSFDHSHHVSVHDLTWLQSKTHSELVSTSPDGQVLWWDIRNLSASTEKCVLPSSFGGTCVEWQQEAGPTKYLVGTEQGVALSLTKKPKKPVEVGGWFGVEDHGGQLCHYGPIHSIKRNPFHPKYFLTVADWTVKLWLEDLKGPVFQTAPSPTRLTSGSFSASKPGVFFATRFDGIIDFYDINYQMSRAAHSHKIGDQSLTACAGDGSGRFVAVGDSLGSVSLVKLCDDLAVPASNTEKTLVGSIFEREQRRERNLDAVRKMPKIARTPGDLAIASHFKQQNTIDQQAYLERERDWLAQVSASGTAQELTVKLVA